MERCAVVIGVNKTGSLPPLQAAVSGAKEFARWATENQKMQVTLITDEDGSVVTVKKVKDAIQNFVNLRTYSQICVFFSGHGILKSQGSEIWLLSEAPDDADAAINVSGSVLLSRNSGIPHVLIISDACRSLPADTRFQQMNGGFIFPNRATDDTRPEVDIFYASLPGDASLELPTSNAVGSYRGIFTECLLEGLRPAETDLVTDIGDKLLGETQTVILARSIKNYLYKSVPAAARRHSIQLTQKPDIRIESDSPKYLAEIVVTGSPVISTSGPKPSEPKDFHQILQDLKKKDDLNYHGVPCESESDAEGTPDRLGSHSEKIGFNADEKKEIVRSMETMMDFNSHQDLEAPGFLKDEIFETGFSITAGEVLDVYVSQVPFRVFKRKGRLLIIVDLPSFRHSNPSALIRLANGCSVPLAVLSGFIGTVLIENGRVSNVTYRPSPRGPKFMGYERNLDGIESRRAYVAAAIKTGQFRIGDIREAEYAGSFLRNMKSFDPTMSLYASYAYLLAGNFVQIESVYQYMQHEDHPVLFDVALLAGGLAGRNFNSGRSAGITRYYAPFCPMLTQGWLYLEPFNVQLAYPLNNAAQHLVPGLWTTFTPEMTDRLFASFPDALSAETGNYLESD